MYSAKIAIVRQCQNIASFPICNHFTKYAQNRYIFYCFISVFSIKIELEKLRNVDALANATVGNLPGNMKEELIKPGKFGTGITFCYNSGSSSAIRRRVTIKDLFST